MKLEVKSLMTGAPISVEADSAALAALDLMIEHGIRHLPVVDREGRVRGVVAFEDLRAALPVPVSLTCPLDASLRERMLDIAVSDVMSESAVTIEADSDLQEAVDRMLDGRFGCLPVVDERGHLDGILTQSDLLEALATVLWSEDAEGIAERTASA